MTARRGRELGPDPRLNGQGVPLTLRQYGLLGGIAVLIGGTLVLVLVGISYGAPPAAPSAARIVLTGASRADVAIVVDGGAVQRETVVLPWTAPIDHASGAVTVQARPVGGSATLVCTVYNGSGAVVQRIDGVEDRAVECAGTLR